MSEFDLNKYVAGRSAELEARDRAIRQAEADRERLIPIVQSALPRFVKLAAAHGYPEAIPIVNCPANRVWKLQFKREALPGYDRDEQTYCVSRLGRNDVNFGNMAVLGIDTRLYDAHDSTYFPDQDYSPGYHISGVYDRVPREIPKGLFGKEVVYDLVPRGPIDVASITSVYDLENILKAVGDVVARNGMSEEWLAQPSTDSDRAK